MARLSVYDAKARFSEVVEKARGGVATEITKHGRVVAKVVPAEAAEWDRSEILDEAERLRKSLTVSERVNLAELIAEGRL